MISHVRNVAACLIILFLSSMTGSAAGLPDTFLVSGIKIVGEHQLKKKEILSVLAVRPPAVWRIWARRPAAMEEDIADDAVRITQLYKSHGFYHVVVGHTIHTEGKPTDHTISARVTYTIEEGPPIRVDSIVVDPGDLALPVPATDLLQLIPLKTGQRFEEKFYRESKKLILEQLGARGYPLAEVAGKALIYPATNKAAVTFSITAGRLCYFGDTTLIDDKPVVKEKILDRARTYQPGEIYDTLKVEKNQRNLYNLDVFKAASIQPGKPDPDTGRVPMSVELKPKKKQSVKMGIGYGDEDGVRLKAGWTYRNLAGNAGKLKFEAQRSDLMQKASMGYDQPYFRDSISALQTEAGMLRETLDSYDNLKLFGTVRLTRKIKTHQVLTAAYLSEYNEIQNLNLVDPRERIAFRQDNTFFTSSLFVEISLKNTDSDTNPAKGSVVTGSFEIAPSLLGSELTYIKPSIELIKYLPLPFRTVLAGRIKFETISDPEKNETMPIFKRLFLGGANTVRGYAFQSLGPIDATGNPEGGQTTALANIELRRPIIGIVSGVLFLDVGMVEPDGFQYNMADLRYGAGGGIRVNTPVGPLRLDLGYKLNPPVNPGGTGKVDRWRLHFNIGHAF